VPAPAATLEGGENDAVQQAVVADEPAEEAEEQTEEQAPLPAAPPVGEGWGALVALATKSGVASAVSEAAVVEGGGGRRSLSDAEWRVAVQLAKEGSIEAVRRAEEERVEVLTRAEVEWATALERAHDEGRLALEQAVAKQVHGSAAVEAVAEADKAAAIDAVEAEMRAAVRRADAQRARAAAAAAVDKASALEAAEMEWMEVIEQAHAEGRVPIEAAQAEKEAAKGRVEVEWSVAMGLAQAKMDALLGAEKAEKVAALERARREAATLALREEEERAAALEAAKVEWIDAMPTVGTEEEETSTPPEEDTTRDADADAAADAEEGAEAGADGSMHGDADADGFDEGESEGDEEGDMPALSASIANGPVIMTRAMDLAEAAMFESAEDRAGGGRVPFASHLAAERAPAMATAARSVAANEIGSPYAASTVEMTPGRRNMLTALQRGQVLESAGDFHEAADVIAAAREALRDEQAGEAGEWPPGEPADSEGGVTDAGSPPPSQGSMAMWIAWAMGAPYELVDAPQQAPADAPAATEDTLESTSSVAGASALQASMAGPEDAPGADAAIEDEGAVVSSGTPSASEEELASPGQSWLTETLTWALGAPTASPPTANTAEGTNVAEEVAAQDVGDRGPDEGAGGPVAGGILWTGREGQVTDKEARGSGGTPSVVGDPNATTFALRLPSGALPEDRPSAVLVPEAPEETEEWHAMRDLSQTFGCVRVKDGLP
jgi:hypothetical protein